MAQRAEMEGKEKREECREKREKEEMLGWWEAACGGRERRSEERREEERRLGMRGEQADGGRTKESVCWGRMEREMELILMRRGEEKKGEGMEDRMKW